MKIHKGQIPLLIAIPENYYQKCMDHNIDAPTMLVETIRHGEPFEDILEKIKKKMCDSFCRVPHEAADKEEADELCKYCSLNKLEEVTTHA